MRGRSKRRRREGQRARARVEAVAMPPLRFEPSFTHFRLLLSADSASLDELLMRCRGTGPKGIYEWPALPLRDARRALIELVEAELVDVFGGGGVFSDDCEKLTKADAIAVLQRDEIWAARRGATEEHD